MSSSSIPQKAVEARYETLRTLGQGGAGTVYLARDRDTGAIVAIKKLLRMDPKSVLRLKREFRALADLRHRNLVELYDLSADVDGWSLTMEYVDGVDLFTHLRHSGFLETVDRERPTRELDDRSWKNTPNFDLDPLLRAFEQLALGVRALHRAGLLHRDLKPSNVLVTNSRVVVLDFGLVRDVDAADALLSQDGLIAGTPAYMSPEQAGAETLSEATDWYAFGVMLFQVLTGQLPIDGRTPMDLIIRKMRSEPQRIDDALPWLPRELVELCNGLLRREPELRPTGDDVLRVLEGLLGEPVKGASPTTRELTLTTQTGGQSLNAPSLVGRFSQLAQLQAALQTALGAESVVAHVRGASGAGKSALVEQFTAGLTDDAMARPAGIGPLVLTSRCNEREAMPFKALDGVIDGLSRYLLELNDLDVGHLLPLDVADLAQLFPVMQRVPGVRRLLETTQTRGDALQTRIRGEGALRELVTRVARKRPLVVWIDDLQWGDLDSANILKAWPEQLASSPLLLIFSYRIDEMTTSPCLRELLEQPARMRAQPAPMRIIELAPLGPAEVHELCERKLGSVAQAHPELIERISSESQGNPFLVSQLAALVLARVAQGDTELESLSIEQMIEQIESLVAPEATRLLHVLAVAGRPLAPKLALRAAGVNDDGRPLVHALRSLRVIRVRDTGKSKLLEMYHDRVREGVVASLDAAALEDIHAALFSAVENTEAGDPDWLFSLALASLQPSAALRYGLAAAERAEKALAFERAAELIERCLELSDPTCPDGVRLQRRLAECLARAGHGVRAAAVYLQAAQGVDAGTAVVCMRLAASHLLRCGEFARGDRIVRDVLAARGFGLPESDAGVLAALAWERSLLALRGLEFTPAEHPVPDEVVATLDLFTTLAVEYQAYDPLRATLFQSRALRQALSARRPYNIARALCVTAIVTCVNGSARAARETDELLERAEAIAEELGDESLRADVLASRAVSSYMLARTNAIVEPSYQAERIYRADPGTESSGDYFHRFVVIAVRIGALMTHGDYERALIDLHRTSEEARATNNRNAILQLSLVQTLADGLRDDYASAKARLEQERKLLPQNTFGPLHTLHMLSVIRTACGLHDYEWADAWIESDWKRWKRSLMRMSAFMSTLAIGAHLRYLVNRHVVERRADDLEALVRGELRIAKRIPFDEASIGLVARTRARLAFISGRRESAIEELKAVIALLDAVGARGELVRERCALAFMIGGAAGSAMATECEREMRALGFANPLGEVWANFPELREVAFRG